MAADGNCLFRAVADQLEGDEAMHDVYRAEACEYILENKDMYVPFIEDDETIEQYVDDMCKSGIWGGQLEMNALANVYEFNVIIHQVDHPSMAQVFHEPIGVKPTIHLSFHLGEHYNSVRRGDDPVVRGEAAVVAYPIGHDLEKIKNKLKNMDLNLDTVPDGYDKKKKGKGQADVPDKKGSIKELSFDTEVLQYASLSLPGDKHKAKQDIMEKALREVFQALEFKPAEVTLDDLDQNHDQIIAKYQELELQTFDKL